MVGPGRGESGCLFIHNNYAQIITITHNIGKSYISTTAVQQAAVVTLVSLLIGQAHPCWSSVYAVILRGLAQMGLFLSERIFLAGSMKKKQYSVIFRGPAKIAPL